ncbi:riboflavin synthase [Halosimplex litoreum]|uniref:Riboflavin synthase n=1 Tax=Halosimplex litoreum TaxID=1198301 RepID=A0A7T3FWB7_9EURY|nr:riboflavin synthase [Halosimplex litoreum]QPV61895.1 riboflavin synthase [Halosimplex litoreum]
MFTGIVEETGEIVDIEDSDAGRRLRIATGFADLTGGQSISVDGACLTVEDHADGEWFSVFLAAETLERTTFDSASEGQEVNLERALAADERFDGHVVQGHVDGTTEIVDIERVGEGPASEARGTSSGDESSDGDWAYTFELPPGLEQYVVEKGSIALDGISLTVAALDDAGGTFSVAIIPTTYHETTLSAKEPGDPVHVEVDVFAKYVERMLGMAERDAEAGADVAAVREALGEYR